ncbi:MAG: D-alanyl-D-alanine dipeptidase [Alphaproteobacteria bacterium]|nr:MAG: D-alanyl-D-alanine dipeptidase [Alphaproteobacteria bacterium]
MTLVPITEASHGVVLDLRYATANNITGAPLYQRAEAWLHQDAAEALARAVSLAARQGLRLRLFDAYRPPEAQWRLYRAAGGGATPFVADPRKGSPHTRGVAVDLTLIGPDGSDLEMGTGFDDLTPNAFHGTAVGPEAERNRLLLLGLMSTAGWDFYSKEWWHYQLFNARRYPLWTDSTLPRRIMAP